MKIELFLILSSLFFAFTSCQTNQSTTTSTKTDQVAAVDQHNAANSLDWAGTYKGLIPCADCEGIETTILLSKDETYKLTTIYKGKSEAKNELSGRFSWNELGNTLIFSGIEDGPTHYFVGENTLIQLDLEGNRITGELESSYILKKIMTSESKSAVELTGVKWKLTELFGQPITSAEGQNKEAFIVFKTEDSRIYGSGSCNNFNGSYELKAGNRIMLTGMATTMMACQDMQTEQAFFKALNDCDNYTLVDGVLSLNKARMAPMAKLIAEDLVE
jgi:heat shock protein HslJ